MEMDMSIKLWLMDMDFILFRPSNVQDRELYS